MKNFSFRHLSAWLASLALLCALSSGAAVSAQKKGGPARARKLPSAEKVVGDYLKAVGGRKRLAAIRDAIYVWEIRSKGQLVGAARSFVKSPVSTRAEQFEPDGLQGHAIAVQAVSARSAWRLTRDGRVLTLTDAEAGRVRLSAALEASRFVDYKKHNILARTVAYDETLAEPTYVVEFSTKGGARLRYWFGARSRLLLKREDPLGEKGELLGDYRAEGGVLEPHRLTAASEDETDSTLVLLEVRYNTGLSDALFDPPAAAEGLDIPALLREVEANQKEIDERVANYAFTEKKTEREINDKGEVKKEQVTVSEVYPLPGGGEFRKVISENGVPLSPERAAKQDKEIAESVARYEREREKKERKKREEESKGRKKEDDDDNVGVSVFLRACEFVSPRREYLRDRAAVVFDFRPRPGFKPNSTAESIVSKLTGVAWIDPVDKTVMRLEAKLAESYKIGGGLVASIRPGSAFVFEQTRMAEGVWLPRLIQVNFAAKIFFFKGIEQNQTLEFGDYRRFDTEASDYKLGAPATPATTQTQP